MLLGKISLKWYYSGREREKEATLDWLLKTVSFPAILADVSFPSNCTLYSLKPHTKFPLGRVQISLYLRAYFNALWRCSTLEQDAISFHVVRRPFTHTQLQFFVPVLAYSRAPALVPLDKGNGGCENEIGVR